MPKKRNDQFRYDAIEAALNLQPGDTVVVLKKARGLHLGWDLSWVTKMNLFVGEECLVDPLVDFYRGSNKGIPLRIKDPDQQCGVHLFPAYVLKVVHRAAGKADLAKQIFK